MSTPTDNPAADFATAPGQPEKEHKNSFRKTRKELKADLKELRSDYQLLDDDFTDALKKNRDMSRVLGCVARAGIVFSMYKLIEFVFTDPDKK